MGKTSLHKGWSAFGKNDTGACFPGANPVFIRSGALSSKMTSAPVLLCDLPLNWSFALGFAL